VSEPITTTLSRKATSHRSWEIRIPFTDRRLWVNLVSGVSGWTKVEPDPQPEPDPLQDHPELPLNP
jgi:hypothetical protein